MQEEQKSISGSDIGQRQDHYRVLARAYRPTRLSDLIGQDAMVRILVNAFASYRIAHAFLLCGERGVGKTTTARILARSLNCSGMGESPTASPCGACSNCQAIDKECHSDVVEMDAASRTGVEDVREIIEGVRYTPVQGRYRIFIIDEVHMLSKQAFNALLKTLEEPPPHVIFIFATTEVRRLPVTVISRCQRFDLRLIDQQTLAAHIEHVAAKERVKISSAATALIARAAGGSVRDSLSLLDQAITFAIGEGHSHVKEEMIQSMLGLADGIRLLDLLESLFAGHINLALTIHDELCALGANPSTTVQDMMEAVHQMTRAKLAPHILDQSVMSAIAQERIRDLAAKLSLGTLVRAWQILLRGFQEMRIAPKAERALAMLLIRFAHAADLPDPAQLIAALQPGKESILHGEGSTFEKDNKDNNDTLVQANLLPLETLSQNKTSEMQPIAETMPPLVQAALEAFPDVDIVKVRSSGV